MLSVWRRLPRESMMWYMQRFTRDLLPNFSRIVSHLTLINIFWMRVPPHLRVHNDYPRVMPTSTTLFQR